MIYRDDRESLAAQLAESQQEAEELRKQLAKAKRVNLKGALLLFTLAVVVPASFVSPTSFVAGVRLERAARGEAPACYVRDCTERSVYGLDPRREVCLYKSVSWGLDETYGRFESFGEAICAAEHLNCLLEAAGPLPAEK